MWISQVKVIHWPWSKVPQIQHFQTFFYQRNRSAEIGEQKFVQLVQVARWPPCPYMVKTWKILFLWNQKADDLESLYAASSAQVIPSLFKWWPWVLRQGQICPLRFYIGKSKTMDFFSETIVVYDIKVGICNQLNEYVYLYEYQGSRSLIYLGPNLSDSIFLILFS